MFGLSKCDLGNSSGGSQRAGVIGRLQKSKGMQQRKGRHQKEKAHQGRGYGRSDTCETFGHIKVKLVNLVETK